MTAAKEAPAHSTRSSGGLAGRVAQVSLSPPSAPAAIAIGVGALFIALTCWWLMRNRAMPYGDAGFHLVTALEFHDAVAGGDWTEPFTWHINVYPPLTPLVGALGFFFSRTVAAPILAENLIFVPLLGVACYRIARRAYGSLAGCLAVVFALGAPMIAEQFHVLMLDAPLTALVAATVWLVLESERFERVPIAALAGVVAGLGLLSKQTFPLYVAGFILVVLARDRRWRNVRGFGVFVAGATVVAAPWYVVHATEIHRTLLDAGASIHVTQLAKPPLLSLANLSWYFWALANGVLFTPLLVFAVAGVVTSGADIRRRTQRRETVELFGGLILALAAITAVPHKDVRYAMPLLVFLAVLGTGWVARLRPTWRTIAIAALALAVVASTMGATFGVGRPYHGRMPGNWYAPRGQGVMPLDQFTVYSNHDYMVSGPRRAGDLLGLLDELHKAGVRELTFFGSQAPPEQVDYNGNGLLLFARLAHLSLSGEAHAPSAIDTRRATLIYGSASGGAPPCVRLHEGGVWIRLGEPEAWGARDYCPRFAPRFYGP